MENVLLGRNNLASVNMESMLEGSTPDKSKDGGLWKTIFQYTKGKNNKFFEK